MGRATSMPVNSAAAQASPYTQNNNNPRMKNAGKKSFAGGVKPVSDEGGSSRVNSAVFTPRTWAAKGTEFVNQMITLFNSNESKDFTLANKEDNGAT